MKIAEVRKLLKELGANDVTVTATGPYIVFDGADCDWEITKDGLTREDVVNAVKIVTGEQQ